MLAEILRAPARSKGVLPYAETLAAIAALAALNAVVVPEKPGMLETNPHPLLMVVLLAAGRYGLLPGLFAAAASIATLSAVCHHFLVVPDLLAVLREGTTIPVVPLLILAIFVGELRGAIVRKYREIVGEYDLLAGRFDRLAKAYTVLSDEKYLLQKAVLSERSPLEFIATLVETMDTLDEGDMHRSVTALMTEISRAEAVGLYRLEEGRPMRLMAMAGGEFPPALEPDALARRALETGYVATVADLGDATLASMAGSRLQVAVPMPRPEDQPLYGLVLLENVPLASFSRVRLKALEVAGRIAGRMASRIALHQKTMDRNVLDPRIDASTPFYLRKRGAEELGRSRDRGLPLSAVVLRIPDYGKIQAAKETLLLATLASVLSRYLRPGQILARSPEAGAFVILMPLDGVERARDLAGWILDEVLEFRMRPYGGDRTLEPTAEAIAIHPGAESWDDAERLLHPTITGPAPSNEPDDSTHA